MSKKHITVKLECGLRLPWAVPPENGRVVGTIRQGQEFGYLVLMPSGEYVQVNGAVVRPLSSFRVRLAMRNAAHTQETQHAEAAAPPKAPPKPVIVVRKKRRTIERETLQAFSPHLQASAAP